jgi:hypothetical protein
MKKKAGAENHRSNERKYNQRKSMKANQLNEGISIFETAKAKHQKYHHQ